MDSARIKPTYGDYDTAASSSCSDSPALHLLLQSHISHLATEVPTQALSAEQQARQLLETQLITFQSAPHSLETSQTVQQRKRQEASLKGALSSPISSLQATDDLHTSLLLSDYNDSKGQLARLQRDFGRVQEALDRAEEHNRELVEELDRLGTTGKGVCACWRLPYVRL